MRTTSWSLLESLHDHIDLVQPTTMFRGGLQAEAATFKILDKAPGEAAVISIPSSSPILAGGTSASSPTFADIVALLNDARIAAGKSPLGFLNPLIYSKGTAAFNDITVGSNPECGTQGFSCAVGWDPG